LLQEAIRRRHDFWRQMCSMPAEVQAQHHGQHLCLADVSDVESTPVLVCGSVPVSRFPVNVFQCILMHVDTQWL